MPAIYLSFEIEPGMTIEQKQSKLYLGVMSAGEQAYTLGAAIAECRKQLAALDNLVSKMRQDFQTLKLESQLGMCDWHGKTDPDYDTTAHQGLHRRLEYCSNWRSMNGILP